MKLPHNPIITWVNNRIKKNKNVIMVINGGTGSGKTYAALELAFEVSELNKTNFNVKDNVAFNVVDLLKHTMLPQNQKPGTCFVFEEVGAVGGGASSREWQSKTNKFFFSFMQTTRHRNQILIMTCPHFSFLEKGARSLVHMQMETQRINFEKGICYLKPFCIQVNSRTGMFYFKYLRVKYDGQRYKFNIWEAKLPPKDMLDDYEVVKTKFTSALNKEIIRKEKPEYRVKSKIDKGKLKELLDKKCSKKEIARIFGCNVRTVFAMLKIMREKGEL